MTSHLKQRLELATLPTDQCVKRVYSNMLTSTKSTGGQGAADVSQEEEDDEGLRSGSQAPPRLSCKHEPSFSTNEKTVKPQWDIRIVTEGLQISSITRSNWSKKLSLIRFLLTNTGQQGRHTRVRKEGLFFKKWYFQELKYNSTGRVIDTHSMVSVAGVKLAAKHVQLHNCSAMGKTSYRFVGFWSGERWSNRASVKTLKLPTKTKSDQFA